jgi:hypothetical protein
MRTSLFAVPILLACASIAGAQAPGPVPTPEIRSSAGAYVPVGAMRGAFEPATMLGAQLALELSPNFHLVGSGSWTHGHNKLGLGSNRTIIRQYDIGGEANLLRPLGGEWLFRPFVGVGGGWRTYEYRTDNVPLGTCTAGYAALGSEFERGAVALRAEARDYLSCFESPTTGRKTTRNDLGVSFGLAYHLR